MRTLLGNNAEKDFCNPQSYCSIKQYTHTDPIQQHFNKAPAACVCSVRVWGRCVCHVLCVMCVSVCVCLCVELFCLFLSLIILPLEQCPLRSPFFFCPHFLFFLVFLILFQSVFIRAVHLPLQSCVLLWQPTLLQGLVFCLVRGFQFPYITLRIPVLFDFGLHDLFAWVYIFESKNHQTEPGRILCITLCQSWLSRDSGVVSNEWPLA